MRRAFENKAPRSGVKSFVVFAYYDEVNVLGAFVFQRTILRAIQFHRTEIDVLLQLETQAEQNAFLQNARLDLRMAHGAEEDRLELAQFGDRAVRQHFARLEIAFAAEIVFVPVDFEAE